MSRAGLVVVVAVLMAASCGSPAPRKGSAPTTVPAASTTPPATSTTTPTMTTTTTVRPTPTTSSPTLPAQPATVITRGTTDRKLVALTFDAGSDAGNTARILAILGADGIHATFGITGLWAQANPALVRQIAAAGNQIVNHTWDHRSFTGYSTGTAPLSATQISQELQRTDTLVRQLTGTGTGGWFRPPYGDRDATVDRVAGAAGYRYELMWTVDTLGWKGVSPETVVQRCLASAMPGEIILMHVGSASTDATALPSVIAALRAQGYSFASVLAMA